MARLTFSGTTQEVLLAITATDIDSDTKVTITDNKYTLANLLTIVRKATTYKVVLQKTAAAVAIEGDAADLKEMLAGVDKYTGALKATDVAGFISAADLNTIAAGTTGKVTATLDPATTINAALVAALKDVKATDAITFAPTTDTDLNGNAEINALISLNKILPKADWSNIAAIEGTANDVSIIKQALAIAKNKALTVEITGTISAEDANAIAKLAGGALTATIKDGSVAATLKALKDVNTSDVLTFESTDKTVKATDLFALSQKIPTGDYTSIETITADAKDVSYVSAALGFANGADVTITGTITAAQANAIAANTNAGDITATVEADTAANLVAKLVATGPTDILTLAVNGTTAAATDLNTLATAKTGGKIKLDATEVTGDITELKALYVTNKASFTALGNENVTITDAGVSEADLNTIAAATTGKVTATLAPATDINAATVAALKDVKATDAITFKTDDTDLDGKDELNALLAIKKLIPNADFSKIVTITADAKDVALVKSVLKDVAPTVAVTINNGDISAADAAAIAKSSGAVTATIKDGSVAATLKVLKDVVEAGDDLTFKTTDKTVKATDLVELDALVDLDATSVKTITGDAGNTDDIKDALTNLNTTSTPVHPEVKISGIVANNDTKIAGILANTNGKVTAKIAAGTADVLKTTLTGGTDDDALDVTVNGDTALATDLALIDASTGSKVKVDAKKVTGDFNDLNTLYFTNKAHFSNLGNEDVNIDDKQSALNVDTILKATTGVVTAELDGDKANILVSQLNNANAKDELDITVLKDTNGTSAKDLIALTKKTKLEIDAKDIKADGIVGSVADINAVIKAKADGKLDLDAAVAYIVTGTISAKEADSIADKTTGVVTATIKADTAAKLNEALTDSNSDVNAYKLTVNGATADAAHLKALKDKTSEEITLTVKEITGTAANVTSVLEDTGNDFIGEDKVAVKLTEAAAVGAVNAILAATTGVVTATVNSGTAEDLVAGLTNATAKDKLTLKVTGDATATELLALDDKTAVKVDASEVTAISGSVADLKKLVAAKKGVELAPDVNITVNNTSVEASDLGAILKSTTGIVSATVSADTAAKLNKALTDKDVNALTLTVNGATATAKDLISLDGKTSATITLNVGAITGNIAEITKVFTDTANGFTNEETTAATISGDISAADANYIANKTSGVVTATIKADSAAVLNTKLVDSGSQVNAYKLTVNGTTADAADLVALDGKTSVTVNAAAIKNIEGTATAVKAAYDANANKTISGLGNETVDLTGVTDADAALVNAINNYTTGLITLDTIKTATTGGNFSLSQLGDLKGITGLAEIKATTGVADIINISLEDLLAANDSKGSFTFKVTSTEVGATGDAVKVTNDLSGWKEVVAVDNMKATYTNDKTGQVVTIEADAAVINV